MNARTLIVAALALALAAPAAVFSRLGNAEVTTGDYRDYWRNQAALKRVTPADVHAVARRVLQRHNRTVVIGAPSEDAA